MLAIVLAVPMESSDIVKLQRSSPRQNGVKVSLAKLKAKTAKKTIKLLESSRAFKIDISCPGLSSDLCQKALKGLQSAGERIASVLEITSPITVDAKFYSFCGTNSNCPSKNFLGSANYGTAYAIEKESQKYVYNQALLKQLRPETNFSMNGYDIVAEFNSDFTWFFRTGSNQIQSTETDFEYVAAHELTHGLGFGSSLLEYHAMFKDARVGYLAPLMSLGSENIVMNLDKTTTVSHIEYLDIFDSFISSRDGFKFKDLGKSFQEFNIQPASFSSAVKEFESSGSPFDAAQKAYVAASNGLYFTTITGRKIPLYSPAVFEQGSSIHHLESNRAASSDFLMIPSIRRGVDMEELMNSSGDKIYGDMTIGIMNSIGWKIQESSLKGSARQTSSTKPLQMSFLGVFSGMILCFIF
jgi:hypothetical protein